MSRKPDFRGVSGMSRAAALRLALADVGPVHLTAPDCWGYLTRDRQRRGFWTSTHRYRTVVVRRRAQDVAMRAFHHLTGADGWEYCGAADLDGGTARERLRLTLAIWRDVERDNADSVEAGR